MNKNELLEAIKAEGGKGNASMTKDELQEIYSGLHVHSLPEEAPIPESAPEKKPEPEEKPEVSPTEPEPGEQEEPQAEPEKTQPGDVL